MDQGASAAPPITKTQAARPLSAEEIAAATQDEDGARFARHTSKPVIVSVRYGYQIWSLTVIGGPNANSTNYYVIWGLAYADTLLRDYYEALDSNAAPIAIAAVQRGLPVRLPASRASRYHETYVLRFSRAQFDLGAVNGLHFSMKARYADDEAVTIPAEAIRAFLEQVDDGDTKPAPASASSIG